jgi:branched-chain amino acid transport system substrate-binding protein/urea transport system substrate-binding protein
MGRISRRDFVAITALAGLTAFSRRVAAPAVAQTDTIKIGAVLPLSGSLRAFGPMARVGLELAAAQINGANGIKGRQIEILFRDDKTDPQTANQLARSLIQQDQVLAIAGPVTSSARNAMANTMERLKTPLLYATDYEGGTCGRYLFFFDMVPNQSADPLMRYLFEHVGKTFYMLGADYVWPRKMFQASRAVVQGLGGKVLGERFVPLSPLQDYSAIIGDIAAKSPAVVVLALPGRIHVGFLDQARARGLLGSLGVGILADLQTYADAFPVQKGEEMYACVPFVATDSAPGVSRFVAELRRYEKGNATPSSYTMTHYNALMALKTALEASGEVSREAAVEGLSGLTYTIPTGESTINANNHHSTFNAYISKAEGNSVRVIEALGAIEPKPGCSLKSK